MRSFRIVAASVVGALVLAACAPSSGASPAVTVTVTLGVTPSAEGASTSPTATPFPDASGAIEVSEGAGFLTPSGRIVCGIHEGGAGCTFPAGMEMAGVPSANEACPGLDGWDVNGMFVGVAASFACMTDPPAWPVVGSDDAAWAVGRGFATVTLSGQTFATLPYGHKLILGHWLCDSESHGVTCVNLKTRQGFHLALAGATTVSG